ncbi:MAG: formylglycine-generating enzyme family protein [Gemmatimonadota bacterium]|nr:formylglycine-generating enzyme family protein [Gemmatimonadota bacterium]MDP7032525.1 formylglycine-generating enzyme family protein [Gemmatimonadota bacterium]
MLLVGGLVALAACSEDLSGPEDGPGTITIHPSPDGLIASWTLLGPSGYFVSGSGDQTLTDLSPGNYTVTWVAISGHTTPPGETVLLFSNAGMTVTGVYVEVGVGTIVVDPSPDEVNASWTLTGPEGFRMRSVGERTVPDLLSGEYTVAWDAMSGYSMSLPESRTLDADSTVTFGATYDLVAMEFVLISAGSFMMGSPGAEPGRDSDEAQHEVTLTRDFYMATHEVTQEEFLAVLGTTPSYFSRGGGECPVEQVDWADAVRFCNALSDSEGRTRCYSGRGSGTVCDFDADGYRLPTEAEWEYACRAGTETALSIGEARELECGGDPNLDAVAWYCGNAGGRAHLAARKAPNAWGLYDMHGNVWEWCWDWYGEYGGPEADPKGTLSGLGRVIRGGSWCFDQRDCRSASRSYGDPDFMVNRVGFRPVRTAP